MATFLTYNMHGFNNGCAFLKEQCVNASVICVQEHWLRNDQLVQFNRISDDFVAFAYSSIPTDSLPTFRGRPFGGLAVLVKRSLFKVSNLGCSLDMRVQALQLCSSNIKFLLFNVYFPCLSNSPDYLSTLSGICGFILQCIEEHASNNSHVVICGDFNANWDIIDSDDRFSQFKSIINVQDLYPSSELYTGDMMYTFSCPARDVFTWLDNIFVPASFVQASAVSCDVVDDVSNDSDHVGFYCKFELQCLPYDFHSVEQHNVVYKKIFIWSNTAKNEFYSTSGLLLQCDDGKLGQLCCCDTHCADTNHRVAIDDAYEYLTCSLRVASQCALKLVKASNGSKGITWSRELTMLKGISRKALQLWRDGGCPVSGVLFDDKQNAKRVYKRALKEQKLFRNRSRLKDLSDCIEKSNMTGFWKNWNRYKNDVIPMVTSVKAQNFADVFKDNFIESADNKSIVNDFIERYLSHDRNNTSLTLLHVDQIEKSCKSLRVSNCMDCNDLTVRHLLFAHPSVFYWLKKLFNSMLAHGYVPKGFGHSIIVPVIKNKCASVNDVSNYRPISIEPVCTKLFEQCLSPVMEPYFSFHSNQFGFVAGGGCSKAIFAFRSTVQYFLAGGSRVYVASLDLSKAFDRVNHFGLLLALLKKGLPIFLINVLFSWFSKLCGNVCWNNKFSELFFIKSGVPQGSINGPKFFNCVMDEILFALEKEKFGCYINRVFAGAIAYADDLLLLSSSLIKLQCMLDICCTVGLKFNLTFNSKKSVCGLFGARCNNSLASLELSGSALSWSDKMVYLGITFVFGLSLSVDVTNRLNKFYAAVCNVLKDKLLGFEDVYVRLLLTKCMPILFYGLDSLCINSKTVQALSKSWNMAFRWIFGMRKFDSTRLVLLSCNTMSVKYLIHKNWLLFYHIVSQSVSPVLHNLWVWYSVSDACKKLLSSYDLYSIDNRRNICSAISSSFYVYCDCEDVN
jgi:hypothetical protein